jgi:hypothetical protein
MRVFIRTEFYFIQCNSCAVRHAGFSCRGAGLKNSICRLG